MIAMPCWGVLVLLTRLASEPDGSARARTVLTFGCGSIFTAIISSLATLAAEQLRVVLAAVAAMADAGDVARERRWG
jgi:hydroxyethylthiazole kinase-like sugar kinase family protein